MGHKTYDVILVGGGVMGCATAYYLLKLNPNLNVAILEMDPSYEKASTPLSDGNTRIQFNIKENIQISQYGLEILARFSEELAVDGEKPDAAFRQQGNLFVLDDASREESYEGLLLQQSLGCDVRWLSPEDVQRYYPIYNLKDCVAGTFGPDDGTMSPLAVLLGYKKKVIALGANFINAEVVEILKDQDQIAGVKVASGEVLKSNVVVNTAGAWAPKIAKTVGIDLPINPTKRQVTVIETNVRPDGILPALFLPSGLYCIHEHAGIFIVGKSFPDDYVGLDDFAWERGKFEKVIWPELVEYIPEFDRLKVMRGWAGLYEVNALDGNSILGEWPELKGFYLANGFSGHGFQQCHGVGRYIAELILGVSPTLDLAVFSPQRILDNNPVFESRRKII
ncbi:MAG TPA: FAD-dependent oxidoreductase [Anaerolineales bacterium]|nr:FAD-dependent oxidoreductase [Anaerolineales bacterium]